METQHTALTQRFWEGRAILLLDLDAFFASVEQLDHPEWRGRPVIVGGDADKRGVVSTCSYEAREYGVRSAMPSATAQRLCPDAIWTAPRFARYRELSAQVMEIMYSYSPLLEQVSIDEAFLDVTPGRFDPQDPVEIARCIQDRVAGLGVTCSIGVASGKSIAKIASDLDKPKGLTVVYPGSEAAFLGPMSVRALPGIGAAGADKLKSMGIVTLGDLAAAETSSLRRVFGVNASAIRDRARGIDPRDIVLERPVKSVSHERTFAHDLLEREQIEAAIGRLGAEVGRRLRKKDLAGHTVTLKLRYSDLSIRTAQRTLSLKVDDEHVFIPVAASLLPEIWRPGDAVRLVGLGISGFGERDVQTSLFGDDGVPQGNADVISAADKVRDRFGDSALKFGRELR